LITTPGHATALTRDEAEAQAKLGETQLAAKNVSTALDHFLKADALSPNTASVLEKIARCQAFLGNLDAAIDYGQRLLRAAPSPGATTLLATLLAGAKRPDLARIFFESLAKESRLDAPLLSSFGQLFIQLGQREDGLAAYDLLAEARPLEMSGNDEPAAAWALNSPFTAETPSPRYGALIQQYEMLHAEAAAKGGAGEMFDGIVGFAIVAPYVRRFANRIGAATLLDYGGGRGAQYRLGTIKIGDQSYPNSLAYLGIGQAECFDPGVGAVVPDGPFDLTICVDALEHCDRMDLPWIVRRLFQKATRGVFANIASYPAKKILPNGENAHCTVEDATWWQGLFQAVAQDYPAISYQVIVSKDLRQKQRSVFGRWASP